MKIEILGTGCHDCLVLELLVGKVLQRLGITTADVNRVADERHITRYITVDAIPGLVINGKLVSERKVPDETTLASWLSQATAIEAAAKP